MKRLRIKTNPITDSDKYISINLEQNFDMLEVLSLNITQTDSYLLHNSDYGVVVGRCYTNNGLGIPNVNVSIFIPIDDTDKLDPNFFNLYPYENVSDIGNDNKRYNILPDTTINDCHIALGSFPNKMKVLDNEKVEKVYSKYYKFTTTTNGAGDYMFFGVPTGQYSIMSDCDLSNIGPYSQKPYDMIEEGYTPTIFQSPNQFKIIDNINESVQIKTKISSIYVYPFWGDTENETIGVSRLDIDLNYTIRPKSLFIGSIFSDNEKDSINKNCRPRKKLGNLCETAEQPGTIEMIRKLEDGSIEQYNINGGDLINNNGVWTYRIPMNLDYMITNEMGNLVPTEDKSVGIPTRTRVRFRLGVSDNGDIGRVRTTAKFLVPHNPDKNSDIDYEFGENTSDKSMVDFYWNKLYTVKSFIPRLQVDCESGHRCVRKRTMIAVKDVDDCAGTKTPFPYNKFNGKMNPLFTILCLIIGLVIDILSVINSIFSWFYGIKIVGIRPFKKLRCITINCEDEAYAPGCSGKASPSGMSGEKRQKSRTKECFRMVLAEYIKIYTFDFYNDWVNGSLYAPLLKYKKTGSGDKFCNIDAKANVTQVNTLFFNNNSPIGLDQNRNTPLGTGFIKSYNDVLYYVPYSDRTKKLFSTDIFNLGAMNENDWQGIPMIHNLLTTTSYIIPTSLPEEDIDVTALARSKGSNPDAGGLQRGLFFDFDCDDFDMNENQIRNINRLTEVGVGLDENRNYDSQVKRDGKIDSSDVENKFLRDVLVYLNSNQTINPDLTITSDFDNLDYNNYRNLQGLLSLPQDNSFYFYFGTKPGSSAIDLIKKDYFTDCIDTTKSVLSIRSTITHVREANDGTITLFVEGGVLPYTFEWNDGYTTQNRTNLSEGQYRVTVRDSVGNIKVVSFTINAPTEISFNFSKDDSFYNNNGKIYITSIFGGRPTTIGGVSQYTYKLKLNGPVSKVIDNVSPSGTIIENLPNGQYTVQIEDYSTFSTSVSKLETITLTPPEDLYFAITPNNIECFGEKDGSFTLDIIRGSGGYIFTADFRKQGSGTFEKYIGDKDLKEKYDTNEFPPSYFDSNNNNILDFYEFDPENSDKEPGTYRINLKDSTSFKLINIGVTNARSQGMTLEFTLTTPSTQVPMTNSIQGLNRRFLYKPVDNEITIEEAAAASNLIVEEKTPEDKDKRKKYLYSCSVYGGEIGGELSPSTIANMNVYIVDSNGCETTRYFG